MKNLFLILAIFTLLISCSSEAEKTKTTVKTKPVMEQKTANKKQLRHVVLFKFKDAATPADIKTVEEAFSALPTKIPQIKDYEFGINNSPEGLDKGFTHCFFLTFDSEADRAIYLPHPDHKAFGAVLTPFLEDVLVLDYWTGS